MRSNYPVLKAPVFSVLSKEQRQEIHWKTVEVLERTGVRVDNSKARSLLQDSGAKARDGNIVRIPSALTEEMLRVCPNRVVLANRKGERVVFLEDRNVYFSAVNDFPEIIDLDTSERRPFVSSDARITGILTESLPNISLAMTAGFCSDCPPQLADRVVFKEVLLSVGNKPIGFTAHSARGVEDIVEMAAVAAGSHQALAEDPFIFQYAEPNSPLIHSEESIEKVLCGAQYGVPVVYTPMSLGGATAPVTLAGNLVTCNAEVLSGLVIAQLGKEGAPFIYGGMAFPLDMKTSVVPYGAPELYLLSAALADMADFYNLPMFGTAGCTDSKDLDAQAGFEVGVSCLVAALSGANLVHDVGIIDHATAISLELMVFVDEAIGMIRRFFSPIDIDENTVPLDVIHKVGPGGNYFMEDHTLKHFRECWYPTVLDRSISGPKPEQNLRQKLKVKAKQLIQDYDEERLPVDVEQEIKNLQSKW